MSIHGPLPYGSSGEPHQTYSGLSAAKTVHNYLSCHAKMFILWHTR